MDDNQFYVAVWKIVGTAFCVLAVSIAGCVTHTHYRISEDLKSGVDPLMVACAHNNDGSATACTIAAAKRGEGK